MREVFLMREIGVAVAAAMGNLTDSTGVERCTRIVRWNG